MKKVGEGKTATVYSDGSYAYKVYKPGYDIKNITYEVRIQNEIYDNTDLNVAHYEIVDHHIKMTLIEGVEFADRIRIEHYERWLEDFTDLQCQVYVYHDLNLGDAYQIFTDQIESSTLNDALKQCALNSIQKIDKKYHLCHFDFHPLNIIYGNETYYIIDWTNAKLAHPVMDIASTYIIFRQFISRQSNKYLKMMIQKTGYTKKQILDAIPVMAFIKLRENDEPKQDALLRNLIIGNDIIYQNT